MTLDTQIALALTAPDTFDKVHKNIMSITNDFTIGFAEWLQENDGAGTYEELLKEFKKEKGL